MRMFFRRLATITVVALSPIAIMTLATPAVSSADCGDRDWNPVTNLCVPAPPVPEWYRAAPTWAQSWAPPWAPPPPPAPPSVMCPVLYAASCGVPVKAVWDPRYNQWTFVPSGQ
jgi:hypothetical protein